MDKFQVFLKDTLTSLREKRDNMFVEHKIDKDATYQNGTFKELPTDLLMVVCYIDAYASALANYNDIFEKEMDSCEYKKGDLGLYVSHCENCNCPTIITAESQTKHFNLLKVHIITQEDLDLFIQDGECTSLDDLDVSTTDFDWSYAQRALVNIDEGKIIMWDDNVCPDIDRDIENFLDGITYAGNTYSLKEICLMEEDMEQYEWVRYR